MFFYGKKSFEGMCDTLSYFSNVTDSEETIRSEIVRVLKMGLVRYISKTPLSNYLSISYKETEEKSKEESEKIKDKWNYWVFRISGDADLDKKTSEEDYDFNFDLSASRVTEALKINLFARLDRHYNNYKIDSEEYSSYRKGQFIKGLVVKSLGNHFSAGIYGTVISQTYGNIKVSYGVAPAVEYNIFPYSESIRRELTFLYRIGGGKTSYFEKTIFDKTEEQLYQQALEIDYGIKEQWGSIDFRLDAANYLHDFNKYHLTFHGGLSLRLFEGFSLYGYGSASAIHDQLSLVKGGRTIDEILLQKKQLATDYDFSFRIGISYSFGSIYSNVVNSRF